MNNRMRACCSACLLFRGLGVFGLRLTGWLGSRTKTRWPVDAGELGMPAGSEASPSDYSPRDSDK